MLFLDSLFLFVLFVVFVIEIGGGDVVCCIMLSCDEVVEFVGYIVVDLQMLVFVVIDVCFVVVGVLFDVVELLCLGFLVWVMLDELVCCVLCGYLENVVVFGIYEDCMLVQLLELEVVYVDGLMCLLLIILFVFELLVIMLVEQLELDLVGCGEVGQCIVDWLICMFGVLLEYVCYFS